MKKAYYYLFYKVYQFSEASPSRWLSDWKASLVLDILWLLLFISVLNYYKVFLNPNSNLGEGILFYIAIFTISISNYFIIHHHNQWKKYVREFDKLTKKENYIGGWIVFGLVILILLNFMVSFYLYYQL